MIDSRNRQKKNTNGLKGLEENEEFAKFRVSIETKLARILKIPIVRIVLGQSANKLFFIKYAAENDIPCLFIEVFTE